jgi:sugar O-acyltransferase (sialic acid O-acetyltransferase NeuD family)
MNKPDIILIGAGGHAHACIDVIELENKFRIVGLVGSQEEINERHFGYFVIASDLDLPYLAKEYPCALITVGQIKSPDIRIELFQKATILGFDFPIIVSPRAHVSKHSNIGAGSIIMHDAIVNAGASVGSNCIINTRALVEHDASVEDNCHISTGAILNGGSNLGCGSFLGSGSVVKHNVSLGKKCIVGMGVVVRNHLDDYVQFAGNDK